MMLSNLSGFIQRGGGWVFISFVLTKFSGLLITIALAKNLDIELFGELLQYVSLTALLVPMVSLSSNDSYLFTACKKSCTYFNKISLLKSFSILVFMVFLGTIFLIGVVDFTLAVVSINIYIFTFHAALVSISNLFITYYRVIGINKVYAILISSQSLLLLIFVFLFLVLNFSIELAWPASSTSFMIIVFSCIMSPLFRRKFRAISFSLPEKKYIQYGLSITVGVISSIAAFHLDTIMVGVLVGDSAAGFYKVISMLPVVLLFIPGSYLSSDFKHIVSISSDKQELKKYYIHYFKIFFPISCFLSCIIYVATDFIVFYLLGELPVYVESTKIYMSLTIFFTFLFRAPIGIIFNALGLASFNVKVSIVVLAINIILNYYLINKIGVAGAALSSLLSFFIGSIISLFFLCLFFSGKWNWDQDKRELFSKNKADQ